MGPSLALVVLVYSHAGGGQGGIADGGAGSLAHARLADVLRRGGAQVVSPAIERALEARAQGWRSAAELSFFTRGRSALERGRRARERVDLDEAVRLLTEAEGAYAEGLALPGGPSLAAEAALEHGVALGELGRSDEARAAFRRALALAPGLTLTERVARPDVVKSFGEVARAPVRARRSVAITAGGEPLGADAVVTFDGRPLPEGASHVDAGAGWHVVVVAREGARTARLVEIDDKDSAIEVTLPHDPVSVRLRELRRAPTREGIDALRDALDVGAVVVAALAADERRMLLARVGAGCATAVVEADASDGAALAAAVRRVGEDACVRDAALALRLDDPRLAPIPIAVPAPPKQRKTWPWVFLGAVGATAAIVGVAIGVVVSDPRYTLRVDGRSFGAAP